MEPTEIIQVLKEKEHYKYSVEISQTAKGEPQVTVKTHSEDNVKGAADEAIKEYKRIQKELMK